MATTGKKNRRPITPRTSSLPPARPFQQPQHLNGDADEEEEMGELGGEMGRPAETRKADTTLSTSTSKDAALPDLVDGGMLLTTALAQQQSSSPASTTSTAAAVLPRGTNGTPASVKASPLSLDAPKETLLKQVSRLQTELNVKNKIIQSLKVKEALVKGKSADIPETNPNPSERVRLFSLLERFRSDLDQAKEACEKNAFNALQIEKQRKLAEEEVTYLRNAMASLGTDLEKLPFQKNVILNAEREQILELETKVRLIENENSSLSEQVQYWTRTSKRNQEARLTAEAMRQALEAEQDEVFAKSTFGTLSRSSPDLATQQELKKTQEKLIATESLLNSTQTKLLDFESTLEEAYNAVESMEKENDDLKKQLKSREGVIEELREQVTLLLEESVGMSPSQSGHSSFRNITAGSADRDLVRKYEELTTEYEAVLSNNVSLKKTVELEKKEIVKLEERLRRSESELENVTLSKDVLAKTLEENEKHALQNGASSGTRPVTPIKESSQALASDLKGLKEANEALEWELVELRAQSLKSAAIQKQLNSATSDVERLQTSLDESTRTVEVLRHQVYLLEGQLEDVNVGKSEGELLILLKNKATEIEDIKKKLREAERQLQSRNAAGDVKAELLATKNELDRVMAELETTKQKALESGELRSQVEELHASLRKLESEAVELKTALETARVDSSEAGVLRGQVEELHSVVSGLEEDLKAMRLKLQDVTNEASESARKVEKLEEQNSKIQQNSLLGEAKTLQDSGSPLKGLTDRLLAKSDEIAEKNDTIASLKLQLERLNVENTTAYQPRSPGRGSLESQQELERFKALLDKSAAELEELAEAYDQLEEQSKAKDRLLSDLKKPTGDSEALESAKHKIVALEEELQNAQEELERISDIQLRLEVEVETKEREITLLRRQSLQFPVQSEDVAPLKEQIAKLEQELALASEELNKTKSNLVKLETEYLYQKQELQEIQSQNLSKDSENRIIFLSREVEARDQELIHLKESLTQLEQDRQVQNERLENLQNESKMCLTALETERTNNEQLSQRANAEEQRALVLANELKLRVEAEQDRIAEFEAKINQEKAELDASLVLLKSQEEDLVTLRQRNKSLEDQIEKLLEPAESHSHKDVLERLQEEHNITQRRLEDSEKAVLQNQLRIQELEGIVANLKAELEGSEEVKTSLVDDLRGLESKLTELTYSSKKDESDKQELVNQIESLNMTITLLKSQLEEQTEELNVLRAAQSQSQLQSSDEDLWIQELESSLSKKTIDLRSLEAEHAELVRLFAVLKDELDAKDVASQKLKDELEVMSKDLSQQRALVSSLQQEIEEMSNANKAVSLPLESSLRESQSTIKSLEEEITRLQGRLEIAEGSKKDLDRFLAVEADLDLVAKQVEEREKEIKQVKYLLDREKQETIRMAQKLKEAEDAVVAARSAPNEDAIRLKKQIETTELELCKYKDAVTELQEQFDNVTVAFKESEARSDKITAESVRTVAKLEEQLGLAQEAIEKGKGTELLLQDFEKKIADLESENELLKEQLVKLNDRLVQADANRRLTMSPDAERTEGLASVIEASQRQAEQAEKAMDALQSEMNVAYEKISQLTMDRVERQRDMEQLEDENELLKKQISDLMDQIKELRENFKNLFPGTVQ